MNIVGQSTTVPYPWERIMDSTAGSGDVLSTDNTGTATWSMPIPHPAELESFEEFVIWACGFTDPEHPPSQKKWEEFQKKVQQLAADFVAYKREKRKPATFSVSSASVGLEANKKYGYTELTSL